MLLVLLTTLTGVSATQCGEGEIPDLDGSCVTKVVIPRRSPCQGPSLDNGEIFLVGSGRIVQFYCNTGYVRVPDTDTAICQVQGTWSKAVPVCLKEGCQVPPAPDHGSITTSFNTTLSVFTCKQGYSLSGPAILGCIDGHHWNGSAPLCKEDIKVTSIVTSSNVAIHGYPAVIYILSFSICYIVTLLLSRTSI